MGDPGWRGNDYWDFGGATLQAAAAPAPTFSVPGAVRLVCAVCKADVDACGGCVKERADANSLAGMADTVASPAAEHWNKKWFTAVHEHVMAVARASRVPDEPSWAGITADGANPGGVTPPKPKCPRCGSESMVRTSLAGGYWCAGCGRVWGA